MELKKSKKADLEKYRGAFFQIGVIVTLSLVLCAFAWKTKPSTQLASEIFLNPILESDMISIKREEPKVIRPRITEIIKIMPEDVFFDEGTISFNPEATSETPFDFGTFSDIPETNIGNEPVIIAEFMPTFMGGKPEVEFCKYISKNLHYPQIAIDNGARGRVYVQFVIDSDGRLVNAKVVGPIDPALDEEALRVINSSPNWEPGRQGVTPVKVLYVFPINFVLR